jgi:hypothetical protein
MTRKGPLTWVELPGPYYNTNAQVRDLERLVKQLPQRTSPESATAALGRRPRTAKQQSAQLVASYREGASLRELGARFGIHPDTAAVILRREGVAMRPKGLSPEQVASAVKLYGAGWSSARIGDRLGFNGTTIIATLRKHNMQIRDVQGRDRHSRPR